MYLSSRIASGAYTSSHDDAEASFIGVNRLNNILWFGDLGTSRDEEINNILMALYESHMDGSALVLIVGISADTFAHEQLNCFIESFFNNSPPRIPATLPEMK